MQNCEKILTQLFCILNHTVSFCMGVICKKIQSESFVAVFTPSVNIGNQEVLLLPEYHINKTLLYNFNY